MANYLLDTNILVRAADQTSANHNQAINVVGTLVATGNSVYLTTQNLIEFWAVATRLRTANGLGWTAPQADHYIQELLDDFLFLEDTPAVFRYWRYLVKAHGITSKQVHDTRLVAVMLAHGITHFLTFDQDDFKLFSEITVIHPDSVA